MGKPSSRRCNVSWSVPVNYGGGDPVAHTKAVVTGLDALFELFERVESEAWRDRGVRVSVCLDAGSDESLYVGLAGDRWTLFYLRMPEASGGELFRRSVGDATVPGHTRMLSEVEEDVPNACFVPSLVGREVVRWWWEYRSLPDTIEWRREE